MSESELQTIDDNLTDNLWKQFEYKYSITNEGVSKIEQND